MQALPDNDLSFDPHVIGLRLPMQSYQRSIGPWNQTDLPLAASYLLVIAAWTMARQFGAGVRNFTSCFSLLIIFPLPRNVLSW